VVVSSALGRSVEWNAPSAEVARTVIQPTVPLRLIGLESHSGYSTASRGLWPFGASGGPIDILTAAVIAERRADASWLPMNAAEAPAQIVSGLYSLEGGSYRWMGRAATVVLKSPAEPAPLRLIFRIPDNSPARRVSLTIDGSPAAEAVYDAPGEYTLSGPALKPAGAAATVEIAVDRTFSAPGDARELGIVVLAVGFAPTR
jgi:hypothetical protein